MAVLINFKICDNAKECSGIAVCPTGALSWNEEENRIEIDNTKCVACGMCEKECPIGAIRVASTDEEYKKIEKEIENDPRKIKDLFVDRYGASPLSEFFMIEEDEIESKISDNLVLIECYDDNSIQCLIKSIPVKKITENLPDNTLFYKTSVTDKTTEKYEISELPALLAFENGKLKGKIEGFYSNDEEEVFLEKLKEILK